MKLSEELNWRGYVNQTTYKDLSILDGDPINFYFGIDPSADSMTIGHLAGIKMAECFLKHGHKGFMLVGGATGMIGDPDGKKAERELLSPEAIESNKLALANQIKNLLVDQKIEIVDNIDWFKDINFIDFLRDTGKHVPLRQMLSRDFVNTRIKDENAGLSYAEFSYVLIQAYDFLHLYNEHKVTLQICGSDQWGNSIAGIDLIRRKNGGEANVLSMPLLINQTTGVKFGKSESGAIWLDAAKTTPTEFYQFWINCDDNSLESYLKIFTDINQTELDDLMSKHRENPGLRLGQKILAEQVTAWVHGEQNSKTAIEVTKFLIGDQAVGEADDDTIAALKKEIPVVSTKSVIEALTTSGLASSNSEARRLVDGNAISVNGQKTTKEVLDETDFSNKRLLLRKGKAFKDSVLVEIS